MLHIDMIRQTTISYFICGTASRGRIVELIPDRLELDGRQYEEVQVGDYHGVPVGVLLDDVVEVDWLRTPFPPVRTAIAGSKVTILQQGEIVTDQISGKGWEENPSCVGKKVYYARNGKFTLYRRSKAVGVCLSRKDENGYVRIRIDLP